MTAKYRCKHTVDLEQEILRRDPEYWRRIEAAVDAAVRNIENYKHGRRKRPQAANRKVNQ